MARYTILPERSELSARARSSLHPINAQIQQLTGWVEATVDDGAVDTSQPAGARLEAPMDSLHADNKMVDRELQQRLDTQRYPTTVAEIHKVISSGGGYEVNGELTLRHVTHPVTGRAELTSADGDTLEITGELTLDVRDFQLDPPKMLGLKVYPDVTVKLRIVASVER